MMNRMIIHISVSVVTLLFLNVSHLFAQWTQIPQTKDKHILSLGVHNNTLYLGNLGGTKGEDGVYSIDNGNWKEFGLKNSNVYSLVIKDEVLYAGLQGASQGVYRTGVSGGSWDSYNEDIEGRNVNTLYVKDTSLYVGTNKGLFRRNDTWDSQGGFSQLNVKALVGNTTFLFAGLLTGTSSGGVYRESNGKWDGPTLTGKTIEALCLKNTILLAATNDGELHRSENNANNWTQLSFNEKVTSFIVKDNILFVGTADKGVFCSKDNGDIWEMLNQGIENTKVYSLIVKGDTLFAGTNDGVWKLRIEQNTAHLLEPTDRATNVELMPLLRWDIVTGQSNYTVTISQNGKQVIEKKEILDAQWIVDSELKPNTVYTWKVSGIDEERTFTTRAATITETINVTLNPKGPYAVGDAIKISYDEKYHNSSVRIELMQGTTVKETIADNFSINDANDKFKNYVFKEECDNCSIKVTVLAPSRPGTLVPLTNNIRSLQYSPSGSKLLVTTDQKATKPEEKFSVHVYDFTRSVLNNYPYVNPKDPMAKSFEIVNAVFNKNNENEFIASLNHVYTKIGQTGEFIASFCYVKNINDLKEGEASDNSFLTESKTSIAPTFKCDINKQNVIAVVSGKNTLRTATFSQQEQQNYTTRLKSKKDSSTAPMYSNLFDLQYSPDGKTIAVLGSYKNTTGNLEPRIDFYDTVFKQSNKSLTNNIGAPTSANSYTLTHPFCWNEKTGEFIVCRKVGTKYISIYDVKSNSNNPQPKKQIGITYDAIDIDCSPDGSYIAVIGNDKKLYLYDKELTLKKSFDLEIAQPTCIDFNHEGTTLAIGVGNTIFQLKDVKSAVGETITGSSEVFDVVRPKITCYDSITFKTPKDQKDSIYLTINNAGGVTVRFKKITPPKNSVFTYDPTLKDNYEIKGGNTNPNNFEVYFTPTEEKEYEDSIGITLQSDTTYWVKLIGRTPKKKGPQISAAPSITLQETVCTSIDSSFTIENKGDGNLEIFEISFEPPSVITRNPNISLPLTIGVNNSKDITFSFDPNQYNGSGDITCTIEHNASGSPTKITIKPQKKTIKLSAENNTIAIPDTIYPGEEKTESIKITNNGTYDKTTIKLRVENNSTRVTLDKKEGNISNTGSEFKFKVTSQEEGNFTDKIYYRSECQDEDSSITVSYNVGKAFVEPDKATIKDLQISKDEQISQTLSFTNKGKRYAQVQLSLTKEDGWCVTPTTLDLKSDISRDVTITFKPKEEKDYSTNLQYSYYDGKNTMNGSIPLSGKGANPSLSIGNIDFKEQLIKKQSQGKKLKILNRTQSEYVVTEMKGISAESVFTLKNVTLPLRIKPESTDSSVTVTFEPQKPQEYNEQVIITAKKSGDSDDKKFPVQGTLKGKGRDTDKDKDIEISVYLDGAPKELKPKDRFRVSVKILGDQINKALDSLKVSSLDYTLGLSWKPTHLYLHSSETTPGSKIEQGRLEKGNAGLIEIAGFDYEVLWGATDSKGSIVFDEASMNFINTDAKVLWVVTKGIDYDYNPYCLDNFIVRGGAYTVGSVKSYPNPSTGIVSIEIEDSRPGILSYEAEVYDMYGRRVGIYTIGRSSQIEMLDIPLGQYRLEVLEKVSQQSFTPTMITIVR